MSGRVANPEAVFSGVEGQYAQEMGNLEAAQGGAELSQQQALTQLLYNILQGNNQFKMQGFGLGASVLGQKKAEDQYNEQKPGALDDIMGILAGGAKVFGALKPGGI
jgi:hypothetical protein